MKCKKVISLITTLAMCISMFSAFSVTSFAENDNTYSCDFTSLVKDNADTTYGTADDISVSYTHLDVYKRQDLG